MDVTFNNVLEGARQYFQGLPSPVAAIHSGGNGGSGNGGSTQELSTTSANTNPETGDCVYASRSVSVLTSTPSQSVVTSVGNLPPPQTPSNPPSSSSTMVPSSISYWSTPSSSSSSNSINKDIITSFQHKDPPRASPTSRSSLNSTNSINSLYNLNKGVSASATSYHHYSISQAQSNKSQRHNLPPIAALSSFHPNRSLTHQQRIPNHQTQPINQSMIQQQIPPSPKSDSLSRTSSAYTNFNRYQNQSVQHNNAILTSGYQYSHVTNPKYQQHHQHPQQQQLSGSYNLYNNKNTGDKSSGYSTNNMQQSSGANHMFSVEKRHIVQPAGNSKQRHYSNPSQQIFYPTGRTSSAIACPQNGSNSRASTPSTCGSTITHGPSPHTPASMTSSSPLTSSHSLPPNSLTPGPSLTPGISPHTPGPSVTPGSVPYTTSSNMSVTSVTAAVTRVTPTISGPIKGKRESPLDLSVKTVRQSADSTAKDESDIAFANYLAEYQRNNKGQPPINRTNQVTSHVRNAQLPTNISYVSFEQRTPRTTSDINSSNVAKVDYSPNFTNPIDPQDNQIRSNSNPIYVQHNFQSQQVANPGTMKKTHNYQKKHYQSHQKQYKQKNNDNVSNSYYHHSQVLDRSKNSVEVYQEKFIQKVEYSYEHSTNHTRESTSQKRTSDSEVQGNSKVPRLDAWRQNIDQEIEHRLSTARQQQQQKLQQQQEQSSTSTINGYISNYTNPHYIHPQNSDELQKSNNYQTIQTPQSRESQLTHYETHQKNNTNTVQGGSSQQHYGNISQPNRSNHPRLPILSQTNPNWPSSVTNKEVLCLLRSSLEIKEARMSIIQNRLHNKSTSQQQEQQNQHHQQQQNQQQHHPQQQNQQQHHPQQQNQQQHHPQQQNQQQHHPQQQNQLQHHPQQNQQQHRPQQQNQQQHHPQQQHHQQQQNQQAHQQQQQNQQIHQQQQNQQTHQQQQQNQQAHQQQQNQQTHQQQQQNQQAHQQQQNQQTHQQQQNQQVHQQQQQHQHQHHHQQNQQTQQQQHQQQYQQQHHHRQQQQQKQQQQQLQHQRQHQHQHHVQQLQHNPHQPSVQPHIQNQQQQQIQHLVQQQQPQKPTKFIDSQIVRSVDNSNNSNSTTYTNHKFHFPKAVDSIQIDLEYGNNNNQISPNQSKPVNQNHLINSTPQPNGNKTNEHYDGGFAAYLAARIRTKAELKQVGPGVAQSLIISPKTNSETTSQSNEKLFTPNNNVESPDFSNTSSEKFTNTPKNNGTSDLNSSKINREKILVPLRRKLFGLPDEDQIAGSMPAQISELPPRDASGLRSSSETSVFDFRESDSEGEMPVLERQTLDEMRRDRKSLTRSTVNDTTSAPPIAGTEITQAETVPEESFWSHTFDKFLEQLQHGAAKKRGRKRKSDTNTTKINIKQTKSPNEKSKEIKSENCEKEEILEKVEKNYNKNEKNYNIIEPKKEDSEEDVPLIQRVKFDDKVKVKELSEIKIKEEIDEEERFAEDESKCAFTSDDSSHLESDSVSDDVDSDTIKESVATRLRKRKRGSDPNRASTRLRMRLRSKLPGQSKTTIVKKRKQRAFGDGSDFTPGWEEELYKYKRSLRMPASLINIPRPPHTKRPSSLPDLDPYSSQSSINHSNENKKSNIWGSEDSNSNNSSRKNFESGHESDATSSTISSFKNKKVGFDKNDKVSSNYKKSSKEFKRSNKHVIQTYQNDSNSNICIYKSELITKTNKKSSETQDPFYLEYVKKKSLSNFKDFSDTRVNWSSNIVIKTKIKNKAKDNNKKATIREVFGDDRPASAPPISMLPGLMNETKHSRSKSKQILRNPGMERSNKALLNSKRLLQGNRRKSVLTSKKQESDVSDDAEISSRAKKKLKLRTNRRKFRSGFDYIRKKKKQNKKENNEKVSAERKKIIVTRASNCDSVKDVQAEIRGWVINKGLGETLLHRAARLGYTDVAAYCLEKLENPPSPRDNAGYTPLLEACARGHLEIARLLLMYGANVNESAGGGIRPLHEAAENGFTEVLRLLLSYGADPLLATYAGHTPLSLATAPEAHSILEEHLADVQGRRAKPWRFPNLSHKQGSGYNALKDAPAAAVESSDDDDDDDDDVDDIQIDSSEMPLPMLYVLKNEPQSDQWVLMSELSNILKIKSRETLLKLITVNTNTPPKSIVREFKLNEFFDNARCLHLFGESDKVNIRASKVALIKYTDKVKEVLGIETLVISKNGNC